MCVSAELADERPSDYWCQSNSQYPGAVGVHHHTVCKKHYPGCVGPLCVRQGVCPTGCIGAGGGKPLVSDSSWILFRHGRVKTCLVACRFELRVMMRKLLKSEQIRVFV